MGRRTDRAPGDRVALRARRLVTAFAWTVAALLSPSLVAQRPVEGPPTAPRELRAAWIATVANIDWPSRPGLSTAAAQAELRALIARAAEINLNALFFQVRPSGDALYRSDIEPWSEWLSGEQGKAPSPAWDPLEFAVREAHARGLQLHAWVNPFRARHLRATSPAAPSHVEAARPDLCVRYGGYVWMDPGHPDARAWSLRVLADIVERYDVDGLHLDDYFYPYPEGETPFPDNATWRRFGRDSSLSRSDWRRRNVDAFLEQLVTVVRARRPSVAVGISPFGIWRPDHPPGVQGLDQFEKLYADPRKWLRQGLVDYMVPQLYWSLDSRHQPYARLQAWWIDQNPRRRNLFIGNNASKLANGTWAAREILDQIASSRAATGVSGNVLYSMSALMPGARDGLGDRLRDGPFADPALVPTTPWLDGEPPSAPAIHHHEIRAGRLELAWQPDREAFARSLYVHDRGVGWRLFAVLPGEREGIRIAGVERLEAVAIAAVDRHGNESARRVFSLAR
jgi:uncharacterized lipoprotein YddW (UPF0748 family)